MANLYSNRPLQQRTPGSWLDETIAGRKQRWWWEALADFYMANPTGTDEEAGKMFGRAASTIALIRKTDGFKSLLAQRRAEFRETMDIALQQKLTGVAYSALDALCDKLNKKKDTLPLKDLVDVVKTVGELGGRGQKSSGGVTIVNSQSHTNIVSVPVGVEDLAAARAALRSHQQNLASSPAVTLEGVVVEEVKEEGVET